MEDLDFDAANDIDINSNVGEGLGGDIVMKAGLDVNSSGSTLTLRSNKERGTITLSSTANDIDFEDRKSVV